MNSKQLKQIGLEFDELFYERCDKFASLLQQWGAVHSLSAQLKKEQIEANIIDSIYPMKFINEFDTLADIGTGAGYPGMLLAIANPDKKVTLIEPRAKRVAFLNFVKNALKLPNVEVIEKRVEDLTPRSFDIITSRAVTNTTLLLTLTENISGNDTEYLFYKGSLCKEEVEEAKIKKYEVIPNGEHRNFLYIKRKG